MHVWSQGIHGDSVLTIQFFYERKTALKKIKPLKTVKPVNHTMREGF